MGKEAVPVRSKIPLGRSFSLKQRMDLASTRLAACRRRATAPPLRSHLPGLPRRGIATTVTDASNMASIRGERPGSGSSGSSSRTPAREISSLPDIRVAGHRVHACGSWVDARLRACGGGRAAAGAGLETELARQAGLAAACKSAICAVVIRVDGHIGRDGVAISVDGRHRACSVEWHVPTAAVRWSGAAIHDRIGCRRDDRAPSLGQASGLRPSRGARAAAPHERHTDAEEDEAMTAHGGVAKHGACRWVIREALAQAQSTTE
jgi:hypothetical protein